MASTISQRISLEGSEEIRKQLERLGETGKKAFEEIVKAAEKVGGFDKLKPEEIAAKLEEMGVTGAAAIGKIQAAVEQTEQLKPLVEGIQKTEETLVACGKAVEQAQTSFAKFNLESVKTGGEIVKTAAEITKLGVEIALAVRKQDSLIEQVGKLALAATNAGRAFAAFLPVLGPVGVALGVAATAAAGVAIALEAVSAAAAAVAKPYEKLNNELQTLAVKTGQSFESLQRGEAAFGQIGVAAETFRATVVRINEALEKTDVGAALKKSADEATSAVNKVLEAEKALLEAQLRREAAGGARAPFDTQGKILDITRKLKQSVNEVADAEAALAAAREKGAEATANNLNTVLNLVRKIADGQKGLSFDALVTADSKIKAVGLSLKEAADKGKDAGQVLLQFIANADKLTAMKVGAAFGLSETDIDRVRRYGAEITRIPELFQRIQQAGVLIGPGAAASFDAMSDATQRAESAWARLNQAWQSSVFARVGAAIVTALTNMKAAIIEFAAAGLEAFNTVLSQSWQGFVLAFQNGLAIIGTAASQSVQGLVLAFQNGLAIIAQLVTTPAENAWQWIVDQATAAWETIKAGFAAVVAAIQGGIDAVVGVFTGAWQSIADAGTAAMAAVQGAVDAVIGTVNSLISAIGNAIASLLRLIGLGGGPAPAAAAGGSFAGGGRVGGRGTGTSDSNLVWVSRGEHIMPARAVRQPGVLAFLEALRRSGGNLSRVLDGMGRFARGGLVALPAFADGGMAGRDLGTLTLGLPGGGNVTVRASVSAVAELHRAAVMAQVRSGGRKPSRYS